MRSLSIPILMFGETVPRSPTFVQRLLAAADAALAVEMPEPADIPRFLRPPVELTVEASEDPTTIRAEADSARITAALGLLLLDDWRVG